MTLGKTYNEISVPWLQTRYSFFLEEGERRGPQDRSRTERESTPCITGPGKGVLSSARAEELARRPPLGPLLSTTLDSLLLFVRWEGRPPLPGESCSQRSTVQGCSLHGEWGPGYPRGWVVLGREPLPRPPSPQQASTVLRSSTQRSLVTHTLFWVFVGLPGPWHTCVLPLRVQLYATLISSKSETLIKE